MPTFEIQTPNGTFEVEAPDEAQALQALQQSGEMDAPKADYGSSNFAQVTSGLNEGLGGTLGLPVDLMNTAIGFGMKGANKAFGTNLQPSEKPFLGSQHINEMMGGAGAIHPPTDSTGQQVARRVAKSVGGAVIPGAGAMATAAKPLTVGMNALGSSLAGGAAAAGAQQAFPNNPLVEMGAELVGGMGAAGMMSAAQKASAGRAAMKGVPPTEKLKTTAEHLYGVAEKKGVTAPQTATQQLSADIKQIAMDEGLISPTGRVSEAYPKAREAIRLVDDYATGTMTVPQMKTVRKVLSDAAKSADDSERRMAKIMLDKFDDFTDPLAPELKMARGYYHRAMKADELEELDELATSRAGQFSGSGYENARRTEYRGLERRLIKGDERGWTPDEQKAVSKVAQGTRGSNTARYIGKAAPTGPVSFAASGGIPFYIGNAIGGPALGAAASGVTMGTGFIGREVANYLGKRNAELASAIVRNGGQLPLASLDKATLKKVLMVLGTSAAANRPQTKQRSQP